MAQGKPGDRQRPGRRGREPALVERARGGETRRLSKELLQPAGGRHADPEHRDRAAVVDERVPDARLGADPIPRAHASALTIDDEGHIALHDLPPLRLVRVDVLGNVAAGICLDLGEQIIAVAREPVPLTADRISHYVTHG